MCFTQCPWDKFTASSEVLEVVSSFVSQDTWSNSVTGAPSLIAHRMNLCSTLPRNKVVLVLLETSQGIGQVSHFLRAPSSYIGSNNNVRYLIFRSLNAISFHNLFVSLVSLSWGVVCHLTLVEWLRSRGCIGQSNIRNEWNLACNPYGWGDSLGIQENC